MDITTFCRFAEWHVLILPNLSGRLGVFAVPLKLITSHEFASIEQQTDEFNDIAFSVKAVVTKGSVLSNTHPILLKLNYTTDKS